jgi:hypothetical protein
MKPDFEFLNDSHRKKKWLVHHPGDASHSFQLWQNPQFGFRLHRHESFFSL